MRLVRYLLLGLGLATILAGCHIAKDPVREAGPGIPPVTAAPGLFLESRSSIAATGDLDLGIVNSNSTQAQAVLIERAGNFDPAIVRVQGGEAYDPTQRIVRQFGTRALVYRKGVNLYKVILKQSGTATPAAVRLSSETTATAFAATPLRAQSYDGSQALVAYRSSLSANERYVLLSMDAASAPLDPPSVGGVRGVVVGGINDAATGALSGFLFQDGARLYRTDSSFANPSTIIGFGPNSFGISVNTGRAFFFVSDGRLRRYDLGNPAAAPVEIPLIAAPTTLQFDNDNVYATIVNGAVRQVYRISDSSSVASVLLLSNLSADPVRLTPNFVIARPASGAAAYVSIRKAGGLVTNLLTNVSVEPIAYDNANDDRVFYGFFNSDNSRREIRSIRADGSDAAAVFPANRALIAVASEMPANRIMASGGDLGMTRLLVAVDSTGSSLSGTLKWVDAGTGSEQFAVGAVPGAPATLANLATGSGLPEFIAGAGTLNFIRSNASARVAYRVKEAADSLVQVTSP